MVRGNAERRKQLVALRKADKQTESVRKLSQNPLLATCTEIRARLLSDGVKTICYVNYDVGKALCNEFLREGECQSRKCRFDHSITLSHTNIKPFDGLDSLAGLVIKDLDKVDPGGKLVYDRTIRSHRRQESPIRFILVGDKVVYDYCVPEMYAAYVEEQRNLHQNNEEKKEILVDVDPPITDIAFIEVAPASVSCRSDSEETSFEDDNTNNPACHEVADIEKELDQDLKAFWRPVEHDDE